MSDQERAPAERLLGELDEQGRKILSLRYGLDHRPPRSLREVAELLGCSEEVVREEEGAAMARLRARLSEGG